MSKRRRRAKVIVYTLLILILAIGIPMLVNRTMRNQEAAEPSNLNTEVAAKIDELTESVNLEDKEDAPEQVTTTEPESQAPANTEVVAEEGTKVEGDNVSAPAGYQITVPNKWYYQFVNEGDYQSLNFGSQLFGPDNPYSVSQTNDFYGYVVPASAIPSEAIGSLITAETVKVTSGQDIEKKAYLANIPDVGEVTETIYKFKVNEVDFGLVFYTAARDSANLDLIDAVVKTLVLP